MAENLADANSGKVVSLDATEATGSHHGIGAAITPTQVVDGVLDTINFGRLHGLTTGQALTYHSEGGTSIGGLQNGLTYYVVVIDASTIKLAETLPNATATLPVTINLDPSVATGLTHSLSDPEDGSGFISSGGQVAVDAVVKGKIFAITVAGSVVTNPKPKGASPTELNTAKRDKNQRRGGIFKAQAPAKAGEWGLAVSGSFSLNTIADTTQALVRDAILKSATKLDVSAQTKDDIFAFGGVVALVKKDASADDKAAGIGGAVTINDIDNHTNAFIENSTIDVSGALSVNAKTTGEIRSLALSFSGVMGRKAGVAIAGSVSLNSISNEAEAYLQDSRTTSSTLTTLANDDSTINTDAGGVALSYSKEGKSLAVGAGIAINDITGNNTLAYVDHSTINLTGGTLPLVVQIEATSSPDITSIAFAGALSVSMKDLSGAVAVAVTLNKIKDSEVEASIRNGSTVIATGSGNAKVRANDDAKISADAGGVAVALAKGDGTTPAGSAGAAISINAISKTVKASVDHSTLAAEGEVNIDATSTSVIDVLALGGSIAGAYSPKGTAGAISLGGAFAFNNIRDTIESSIKNLSTVTTTATGSSTPSPMVSLSATDSSTITAKAIGFSGTLAAGTGGSAGGLAIGVALGRNHIDNSVRAYIADSIVTSAGLVKLYSEGLDHHGPINSRLLSIDG